MEHVAQLRFEALGCRQLNSQTMSPAAGATRNNLSFVLSDTCAALQLSTYNGSRRGFIMVVGVEAHEVSSS
jgi:hypothetical protein